MSKEIEMNLNIYLKLLYLFSVQQPDNMFLCLRYCFVKDTVQLVSVLDETIDKLYVEILALSCDMETVKR